MLQPWAERLVESYEREDRLDEAAGLTKEMFDVMRKNMALSAPMLQPWAERLVKYDKQVFDE